MTSEECYESVRREMESLPGARRRIPWASLPSTARAVFRRSITRGYADFEALYDAEEAAEKVAKADGKWLG